jgi:hypothetical protein
MKLRQIIGMYGCRQPHHKTDTHYEWATSEEDLIFHFNNLDDLIMENITVYELSFDVIINDINTKKYFYQSEDMKWKLQRILDTFEYKGVDTSKDKIKELNFNNTIEFLNYLKEKHYG